MKPHEIERSGVFSDILVKICLGVEPRIGIHIVRTVVLYISFFPFFFLFFFFFFLR